MSHVATLLLAKELREIARLALLALIQYSLANIDTTDVVQKRAFLSLELFMTLIVRTQVCWEQSNNICATSSCVVSTLSRSQLSQNDSSALDNPTSICKEVVLPVVTHVSRETVSQRGQSAHVTDEGCSETG